MANNQENTTWQKAMSKEHIVQNVSSKQAATERTIAHLFDERIAIPIYTTGEVPAYHPHHSKPKCLHTTDKLNRYGSYQILRKGISHLQSLNHHHVIDYYIYTLEHILI